MAGRKAVFQFPAYLEAAVAAIFKGLKYSCAKIPPTFGKGSRDTQAIGSLEDRNRARGQHIPAAVVSRVSLVRSAKGSPTVSGIKETSGADLERL